MARKGLALETPSGGSNAPRWGEAAMGVWLAVGCQPMPSETTINVNLTPDLYRYVRSIEKSKRYTSVSEFFREALREKKERDLARRALELKIEEGLKSAREGRVVDGEEAMAELIGELKTRRKTPAKR